MQSVGQEQLESALSALGELLAARGLHYELVLIGGGNLIVRGLVTRPATKDVDILGEWTPGGVKPMPDIPEGLRDAVVDVARAYGLASDWVNLGPASLLDLGLPDGFASRVERRNYGGLVAWLAGRFDMVCFKLCAAVDQGPRSRHRQDLRELDPTQDELLAGARWTITHDPSPAFRSLLVETLRDLGLEEPGASLG